jgi:translation initiation factor IF-3
MYIQNNNNNPKKNSEKKTYIDYNIFSGNIKLVGENGKVEIIDRDDAIDIAKSRGMNLVQISYSNNDYPKAICKIMDYGKFKFEQKKREKENARKSRIANAEAKEIDFSIRIDDGDYNHKVSQIKNFIEEEHIKVKITVKLARREMSVKHMAIDLMKKILSYFDNIAVLDSAPSANGNIVSCTIKPSKK